MVALWVVYGLGVLAGIGIPVAALIGERRIGQTAALLPFESNLPALAMLTGGPGRVVDAVLTDLVERGVVIADAGTFTADSAIPADGFTTTETLVIGAVRNTGGEGLAAVRQDASQVGFPFEAIFTELATHRLVVAPQQRRWGPAGLALTVLAVLAFSSFGMFGNETSAAIAIFGWVPFTLLTGFLVSRRHGYSGQDPRSALGLACLAQVSLPADAPQARRVALGGLAAITDTPLRKAIKGRAPDSTWQTRCHRAQATGIDLLALNLIQPAND
jgi:uncharacterized protein (TIGR04222 family)